MKNRLLALFMLWASASYAQSTRLPVRKQTPSAGAVSPSRPSSLRAEERPTSTKLPDNRATPAAPARPVSTAPRPGIRQRRPPSYSGGLAYEKGDKLLQVGVGLSSYYYGNPFGVTFEAGVDKDISVGAQIDYNSSTYGGYYYGYSSAYRWGYSATYFGLRASYHANRLLDLRSDKFDLYAGLGLGYVSFKWKDNSYGGDVDYGSRIFFNYFIGGKYYFNKHIGAFAEVGYTGISSTRIGLCAKF